MPDDVQRHKCRLFKYQPRPEQWLRAIAEAREDAGIGCQEAQWLSDLIAAARVSALPPWERNLMLSVAERFETYGPATRISDKQRVVSRRVAARLGVGP